MLRKRLLVSKGDYVSQTLRDRLASDRVGSHRAGIAAVQVTCLGVSPFGLWSVGLRP